MDIRMPARGDPDAVAELVRKLCGDYGERAVTSAAVREHHGHGEGLADSAMPDVVVFPQSNEEVAAIVRLCHLARVTGNSVRGGNLARRSRCRALRWRVPRSDAMNACSKSTARISIAVCRRA